MWSVVRWGPLGSNAVFSITVEVIHLNFISIP